MLLRLDRNSGVPVFRQLIEQMRHLILTGQLSQGEQVTSVRELAQQLRLNPMTISKAYGLLESEGYLERQQGIGLFVARPKNELTKKAKIRSLEKVLEQAAVQAAQTEISEAEAVAIFRRLLTKYAQ